MEFILNALFAVSVGGLCVLGMAFIGLVIGFVARVRAGRRAEAAMLSSPLPSDDALPAVLVQLPVYNEPTHVAQAIEHAAALDWPRDRLHIQLLDDSTDETTAVGARAVEELRARGFKASVLHRDNRGEFKAGALRAGLDATDEPFAAVFDVDFTPDPAFLKDCIRPLLKDERVGFVQARFDYSNWDANWLTRGQIMLCDAHVAVEQPGRFWAGHTIQFDGSAGIWRRAAIDEAGGWQGDTLTEDLDLSTRAQIKGWQGVFLFDRSVCSGLPEDAVTWRRQQARWSSGFAQVMRKLLPQIWRSAWPLGRKLSASFQVSLALFYPLLALAVLSGLGLLASDADIWFGGWVLLGISLTVLVLTIVGMTLPGHLILRKGGLPTYLARVPTVPLLYIYLAVVNIRQVMAGMFGAKLVFERTPKARETR